MCCRRMCGVEVLLGYCCDKPRSFGPAVPALLFPACQAQARFGTRCLETLMPCRDPAQALTAGTAQSVLAALG